MFPVDIWGTVAAWTGGILSGLSVLLAIGIIRRDRTLRERAAAANFISWIEFDLMTDEEESNPRMQEYRWAYVVHVMNAGTVPVLHPQVRVRPQGSKFDGKLHTRNKGVDFYIPYRSDAPAQWMSGPILPGEPGKVRITRKKPFAEEITEVAFRDPTGQGWVIRPRPVGLHTEEQMSAPKGAGKLKKMKY